MIQVRHPGATPNAVPWSSMEEQLLCAVVHEFGPNFAFAADVLAACSQLQGIFRRASQCKEKFKQLTVRSVCLSSGLHDLCHIVHAPLNGTQKNCCCTTLWLIDVLLVFC